MAAVEINNISLTGMDWSNRLREVDIDMHLWNKICNWHGDEEKALKWIQLQIKLFSNRHPEKAGLSHIIASIAFVEMANPECPRRRLRRRTPQMAPTAPNQQPGVQIANR